MSAVPRPCSRAVAPLLALLALGGCGGDKDDTGAAAATCTVELAAGTAAATVDGAAVSWTEVAWADTGSGVQVTTGTADGHRLTLVANSVDDPEGAGATVDLGGTEGFGLIYLGSDSHASKDGGGSLTLLPVEDGALAGCFSFTTDGPAVASGTFRAAPLR